jgi:hypothetical protein
LSCSRHVSVSAFTRGNRYLPFTVQTAKPSERIAEMMKQKPTRVETKLPAPEPEEPDEDEDRDYDPDYDEEEEDDWKPVEE